MRNAFLLPLLPLLLTACSADPVLEETEAPVAAALPELPPGPYERVDQVPVPEPVAFHPAQPAKHQLGNGVTVLLMPDPSRPLVELELRVRAGTYSDPAGREGLAEMVAGLLREGGSETWDGDRVDRELAFRGASIDFAAQPRATVGSFACLSEDLDLTLEIFAELLLRPAFPEAKRELLQARLLSAIAQRDDDPRGAADREAMRAFYGVEDPRVRRQEVATLGAIGRADLVAFHAERFGSRRAQIAVYGDFEPEAMLAMLEAAFGDWAPQSAMPLEVPLEAPAPAARRVVLLPRADVNQAELRLLLEGVRRNHPDYPALQLGSFVFGIGGFGNRMISRIRSELGLAYTTGAYWRAGWEQQGLFWATCGTKNESAGLALREMIGVLDGFLVDGVGAEEYEQARNRLLNAQVFEVDQASKVLARVADLEWNGYPWNFHEQAAAAIRELSAEEVVDACRRHLETGRLTVFVLGNPEAFDVELDEFGAVEAWDASAPEPEPAGAAEELAASERGAELAAHLLSSHGGQAAWEAVGATWSQIEVEQAGPLEAVLVYPGRILVRGVEEPKPVYSVLTEDSGWRRGSAGIEDLDAAAWQLAQRELKAKLPLVLMRLARGEFETAAEGEDRLRLTDEDGDRLLVELHEHGLCRAIEVEIDGVAARYEFGAYGLTGGVMLPAEVRWSSGEQSALTRFAWRVNPEVRAEWFEKPVGG